MKLLRTGSVTKNRMLTVMVVIVYREQDLSNA